MVGTFAGLNSTRSVVPDGHIRVRVSCRLSPTGIRFLDILFPPKISAFLTVGLPDRRPDGPDSVGVSVFRAPGRWCPPDQRSLSDRRLPLHNGQPSTPL